MPGLWDCHPWSRSVGEDWPVHIIVVGAGEVGSYVAERLSSQGHHVALIESDPVRFREIEEELDVLTIHGSGTDPETLREAGVAQADLLVAVTPHDETNLLSALLARGSGVSKTVVRVESRGLRHDDVGALFDGADDHLVIDPDEEVAHAVLRLMEDPGAMEVNQMAGGEVEVLTARLPGHAPLVGVSLKTLGVELEPDWDFIVGSITRRDGDADEEVTIIPRGDWILREGDLLTVICKRRALRDVTARMGLSRDMPDRALLLGGGRTAQMLANSLIQRGLDVVINFHVNRRLNFKVVIALVVSRLLRTCEPLFQPFSVFRHAARHEPKRQPSIGDFSSQPDGRFVARANINRDVRVHVQNGL